MKFTVLMPTEINVACVHIKIPLRHLDEEDSMPADFPLRNGETWSAYVAIATGKILDWPSDKTGEFFVDEMVRDEGTYELRDSYGVTLAKIDGYVPHGVVPGDYGDYVRLDIKDGVITNWPSPEELDVKEFFPSKELS